MLNWKSWQLCGARCLVTLVLLSAWQTMHAHNTKTNLIDRLTPTLECVVDVVVILVVGDTCPVPRGAPTLPTTCRSEAILVSSWCPGTRILLVFLLVLIVIINLSTKYKNIEYKLICRHSSANKIRENVSVNMSSFICQQNTRKCIC